MAKISFHQPGGHTDVVDVDTGTSIMRAAITHGINGIIGECGGQAMCATCHVYVKEPYLDRLDPVSEDEDEMLECTATPRDASRSRLGCQITMTAALDEIEVDLPVSQV